MNQYTGFQDLDVSISELYHENSKHSRLLYRFYTESSPSRLTLQKRSRPFKVYRARTRVPLPRGLPAVALGLEETIRRRRSIREFGEQAMDLADLAKILELADGPTGTAEVEGVVHTLRASPSAGNLHPIEVYPILFTVRDQEPGVCHYNPLDHELERLRPGEYRQHIYESITRQEFVLTASVALALTAIFPRTKEKYGERGYRYALLDAGHIAQNVYLTATAMGLGVVSVGGMVDDTLNDLLFVDGVDEAVVYLIFLGKCKDNKCTTSPSNRERKQS